MTDTNHQAPLPGATGGDLPSGKYVLTAVDYYAQSSDGPGYDTFQITLWVNGNTLQMLQNHSGTIRAIAKTFALDPANKKILMKTSQQCGGSGPPAGVADPAMPYSVSGARFTVFDQADTAALPGLPRGLTFTRQ